MSKYIKFTQEEIDCAAHASIKDYLESMGEVVKPSGSEWLWERHDSVKIRGHVWKQHSTGDGGTAIDFLCHFYDMHFTEAVITLLDGNYGCGTIQPPLPKHEKTIDKTLILPPKNENNKRLYAYLCKARGIDFDVVTYFIRRKLIYESADHHNVVFLSKDKKRFTRYAALKGTNQKRPFTGEVHGSDKAYAFKSIGKSHGLFVFESGIDLMSFITLYLLDTEWKSLNYLALGGLHNVALDKVLEDYNKITSITFCFDNDCDKPENRGQNAAKEYCKLYAGKGYETKSIVPEYGDWNEILTDKKEKQHG